MTRGDKVTVVHTCVAAILVALSAARALPADPGRAGQATVTGRVLDAAGAPVEGTRVRFYQIIYGDGPFDRKTPLAGETVVGADGAYTFNLPTNSGAYWYAYFVAEKPGLAIGFASGDLRENRTFDIVLAAPTPLGGVVVDESGEPVAEASVGIYLLQMGTGPRAPGLGLDLASKLLTTSTDAAGRFNFLNLPAGATADLVVRKPGRAMVCTFTMSSGGASRYSVGQTDIRLVQPTESRIEGNVVQKATGRSVAGARLVVTYAQNRQLDGYDMIEPASDGTFVASELPAGEYVLQLLSPGEPLAEWVMAPVPVTLAAGQTQAGVKIEVGKGGILEVAVSNAADNHPVEKASVSIRDTAYNRWVSGVTDAAGIARIRLVPGPYQVQSIYGQGFTYDGQPQTVTVEEGAVKRLAMAVKETPKVRGIVHDPNGAPLADVRLRVLPAGYQDATSDAEGRFEITWERGGWPGERTVFCLVARHEQRNLAAAVEIAEGATTLNVELEPGVLLTGRIVDPAGKDIAGAEIRPSLHLSNWGSSLSRDQVQADDNGRFEVRAVPAGRKYYLYASADGYGSQRSQEIDTYGVTDGRFDVGTVELAVANLAVSGQVVNAEGGPVPQATIRIYGDGQPSNVNAHTDAEGRFTLPGVCAGSLNINVEATQAGRRLSARALTEGGSEDIRIVAREGRSAVLQRVGGKNYEQILATGEKVIAGVAVDEAGAPVASVPVSVCCHKAMRDGRMTWRFGGYDELSAMTDAQGRFAIEIEEDGEYNLRFSPDKLAAIIAYDVPVGKKDLKVTLPEGGTITGRLLRIEKGQKVPIPRAEVKIEQTDRASFSHLGFDRDRTTMTDSEGRFRFEHLRTLFRSDRQELVYSPRTWQISHGEVSETIAFDQSKMIEDFELLVRPDPAKAAPLAGSPLPGFDGIKIDLTPEHLADKRVLVCFFDWEQRPSRHYVTQLAQQADTLRDKGVAIAAVGVTTDDALQAWAKENQIPFPVGAISGDRDETLFTWSIKSLPWLILSDGTHIVTAEGFSLNELGSKMDDEGSAKP